MPELEHVGISLSMEQLPPPPRSLPAPVASVSSTQHKSMAAGLPLGTDGCHLEPNRTETLHEQMLAMALRLSLDQICNAEPRLMHFSANEPQNVLLVFGHAERHH